MANAQDESVCTAKAPAEVVVNQQFQYTVTTSEKGTILDTDFGKFEFLGGPSMGSSTSISIANGHTEQSTQYTYTYILTCKRGYVHDSGRVRFRRWARAAKQCCGGSGSESR